MKESKVVKVWPIKDDTGAHRTWESNQGGTMYVFGVQFEGGDAGTTNTKNPEGPRFKIGEVASYEIEASDNPKFPDKVKYVDNQYSGAGNRQQTQAFKSDP